MVRPIDISNVLNSLQLLGQSNQRYAELERRQKAKRSGLGAQLGGIAGAAIGTYFGGPVGGAAGGAIGSAVGAEAAGGRADDQQVVQSGYQGYQMGSAYQQRQQNQKFNNYYADTIESNPEATNQQKQFAVYARGSSQDPQKTIIQGQSLGVDPKTTQQQIINRNNNTRIVDRGIAAKQKELSINNYEKGSEKYNNWQAEMERLKTLRDDPDIGNLTTDVVSDQVRADATIRSGPYEDRGILIYKEVDPITGKPTIKSLGKTREEKQDNTPSPTLKTSSESAKNYIVKQVGGYPAITEDVQKDLAMLDRLSNVPSKNEPQAQKQISAIQKKYTPKELNPTTETVYLNGKKAKGVYDPNTDTFRFGQKIVPASEVSLEKEESTDWRPQKVLLQKKEGGNFEPTLVSYNPDNQKYKYKGNEIPSERIKPILNKQSRRIYDSQGNIIMEETVGGELTPSVKTETQKEIAGNLVTLSSLEDLSLLYDEKYLQLPEQLKVGGLKLIEKAGFDIDPEDQKRIEDMSAFQAQTVDIAAKYIKQISGVAVSEAEAKRLRKVLPQAGDSPSEFRGKMNSAIKRLKKINLIHKSILNGDIPLSGNKLDTMQNYLDMKDIPPEVVDKIGDRLKKENNWTDAQVGAYLVRSGMI